MSSRFLSRIMYIENEWSKSTTLENANTMRGYSLSTTEEILCSLANKITALVKKQTLVDFFTVGLRWFELGYFKFWALLFRTEDRFPGICPSLISYQLFRTLKLVGLNCSQFRNTSESLGDREMLWEDEMPKQQKSYVIT